MKQGEIIAMAIEASSMARLPWNGQWIFRSKKELMAFAALLAEKAAAKEREACAKLCDEQFEKATTAAGAFRADMCAEAIRARGTKEGV